VEELGNISLSKTARAAAQALTARNRLSQHLDREQGVSVTKEYFLLNWKHSESRYANAHKTLCVPCSLGMGYEAEREHKKDEQALKLFKTNL